ncbi:hypothetical protein CVT26_003880 [Gymnopilus dilepis]|uniref:Uncharacterized protein n=1 Tax=Gymnopilus dilepis TaxID=231916 RepID=A0A409WYL3_9AGAR|nr:hypothetical protein CVT26_003880 [Gymnopilus dilepis]
MDMGMSAVAVVEAHPARAAAARVGLAAVAAVVVTVKGDIAPVLIPVIGETRRRGSIERDRDRKKRRRKDKEKKKDKDKEEGPERRSILTGKKIKLKVKKDKADHERDANRKDLLQFLNSAFE